MRKSFLLGILISFVLASIVVEGNMYGGYGSYGMGYGMMYNSVSER
ncbi:MAG: hypothetical protein AABX86_00470 [Nanoarchaeota archaeon]